MKNDTHLKFTPLRKRDMQVIWLVKGCHASTTALIGGLANILKEIWECNKTQC